MKKRETTTFGRNGGTAARLALALTLPLLAAACGGGGDAAETPTPTVTPQATTAIAGATATVPAPTQPPTEAPTLAPPAEETPHAPLIAVLEGHRELKSEAFEITLTPGATEELDPVNLVGESFPSCAAFVFAFSYQVRRPYPPAGVNIQFFTTEMGHRELVTEGTSGGARVGCVLLEMVNDSAIEVTVEFLYIAFEVTP